jgi:hypothetical protein
VFGTESQRRRHDAVEDDRAHVGGLAAQVFQRDARAVGDTDEIHTPDRQRAADGLDVLDVGRRRVQPHVGVVNFGEARARQRFRSRGICHVHHERRLVGHRAGAGQQMRAARTALVDEDHVPLAQQRLECVRKHRERLEGRLAGSARDEQDGVGSWSLGRTGHPGDRDVDGARGRTCAVLGHPQRRAARRDRLWLAGRRERAGQEVDRPQAHWSGCRHAGTGRRKRCERNDEGGGKRA